jgi:predicted O-methyltransferase YrrM
MSAPAILADAAASLSRGPPQGRAARVMQALWRGAVPYDNFPHRRFRTDLQGWNSHHVFLSDTILRRRPSVIVEVGVWKGGSVIHMARTVRDHGLDAVVIAVDTWLGSWEHWEQPQHFPDLLFEFGYPMLYYTFLANVIDSGVAGQVVPLPLDSGNAAFVLGRKDIRPDVVHIDGGHDYEAVLSDLRRWWPLLRPGGTVIADDYDPRGKVWPTVRQAVDEFLRTTPHADFEAVPYKARFTKPAG